MTKVRNSFLFAVYTGLRHCDMLDLKWENVEQGKITLTMIKTGEEIAIPLIPQASRLIEKYLPLTYEKLTDTVFYPLSNQAPDSYRDNRYLKEIISSDSYRIAKIDKRISFHCARHTFASLHVQANTHMHDLKTS